MAQEQIEPEIAEREFARFLDKMDLVDQTQLAGLDDDDRKTCEQKKSLLLRKIRSGVLVVNEAGEFEFTPGDGKGVITFREPKGGTLKATDAAKQASEKGLIFISRATGVVQARFEQMQLRDFAVCDAIATLFLLWRS